ncbi:division/cell wall cluster transcriptional repressor MraZ [Candidatus Woesebacteria bacterium]|nr:division/cell wall cluster transcriptional repressor MraZ [Candidatus Woesebacteria bacterium]
MLIGSYLGNLGDKRRVAIPKKFLDELGKNPIIAKWYEDCLILVSDNFWKVLLNRLTGGGRNLNLGVRDIERFILGSAFETEPDNQGRIVIPELLAEYANLNKELVFVGLTDRVEIWSKEAWDKKSQGLAIGTKEYIESLGKNDNR